MNLALINQLMEEDENEMLAQQLQQQDYGGGMPSGANANLADANMGMPMDDGGLGIRQADEQ